MAAASGHDLRKQPIYPLPQSKNEGRRELEDQSGNQRDPLQDAEGTWDSIFTGSKVLAALASVALLVLLAVVFLGLLFIALALAIGAIIIGQKYQNENCLEDYEGISFSYPTWLFIFGIIGVTGWVYQILVVAATIWFNKSPATATIIYVIYFILLLFFLVWYVVGGILFFTQVHGSCPAGNTLHDFGLTVFVIQSIALVLTFLQSFHIRYRKLLQAWRS